MRRRRGELASQRGDTVRGFHDTSLVAHTALRNGRAFGEEPLVLQLERAYRQRSDGVLSASTMVDDGLGGKVAVGRMRP